MNTYISLCNVFAKYAALERAKPSALRGDCKGPVQVRRR